MDKSTINLSDIGLELAEQMGLSKNAGKAYADAIFESILTHLEAGQSVNIKMFGKFEMHLTAPKKGRDVNTGETINIPSKQKIKFTMSRALTARYNQKDSEEGS